MSNRKDTHTCTCMSNHKGILVSIPQINGILKKERAILIAQAIISEKVYFRMPSKFAEVKGRKDTPEAYICIYAYMYICYFFRHVKKKAIIR